MNTNDKLKQLLQLPPWVDVKIEPDGVQVIDNTKPRSALEVAARNLGDRAAKGVVGLALGAGAAGAAGAAGIPTTGPGAIVTGLAGLGAGLLAADPVTEFVKRQISVGSTEAQDIRDQVEHPTAALVGRIGGSLAVAKPSLSEAKNIVNAVRGLPANQLAAAQNALGAGVGLGLSGKAIYDKGGVDWQDVPELALNITPSKLTGLGRSAGGIIDAIGGNKRSNNDTTSQIVPNSFVDRAQKTAPNAAKAASDWFAWVRYASGQTLADNVKALKGNKETESAFAKRHDAWDNNTTPTYTPGEQKAIDALEDVLNKVDFLNNNIRGGRQITPLPNYVPQHMSPDVIYDIKQNGQPASDKYKQQWMEYNAKRLGAQFDTVDASQEYDAWVKQITGGTHFSPGSADDTGIVAHYGPLAQPKRHYGLPPSMRINDPVRIVTRYGMKSIEDLGRRKFFVGNAATELGHDLVDAKGNVLAQGNKALSDDALLLKNIIFNDPSIAQQQSALELVKAVQNVGNAAAIQAPSQLYNIVQSLPRHIAAGGSLRDWVTGTVKAVAKGSAEPTRSGAIMPDVNRHQFDDLADIGHKASQWLANAADFARNSSGSNFLERFNASRDFYAGLDLAKRAQTAGDKNFLSKYGAGTDGLTPEEAAHVMAANYTKAIQTTYAAEDLPKFMVRAGAPQIVLRLQRYGIATTNRLQKDLVEPATKGDYGPLVSYLLVSAGIASPVIQAVKKALNGGVSPYTLEKEEAQMDDVNKFQTALHIAELADTLGTFGFAGNLVKRGAAVANKTPGALNFDDPSLSLTRNVVANIVDAVDLINKGEEPLPTILSALTTAAANSIQNINTASKLLEKPEDVAIRQGKRDEAIAKRLSNTTKVTDIIAPTGTKTMKDPLIEALQTGQPPTRTPTRDDITAALKVPGTAIPTTLDTYKRNQVLRRILELRGESPTKYLELKRKRAENIQKSLEAAPR